MYTINGVEINSDVQQYLTTALWSSIDDETPLDDNYEIADCAPATVEHAKTDVKAFFDSLMIENTEGVSLYDRIQEWETDDTTVAHDFWLTRCGHGCGFWDGDYGKELGDELTTLTKGFGALDIYPGDDGKLYFA